MVLGGRGGEGRGAGFARSFVVPFWTCISLCPANATIALGSLFPSLLVVGAVEMSIPGAQALKAVRPWTLRVVGETEAVTLPLIPPEPAGANFTVTLSASEIRTFELTVVPQ